MSGQNPKDDAPFDAPSASTNQKSTKPWTDLEAFLKETEATLHELGLKTNQAANEASLAVYFGLKDLEDRLASAHPRLLRQLEAVAEAQNAAQRLVDRTRLKSHLGKAEMLDAARETRNRLHEIQRKLHALELSAEDEARHVKARVGDVFRSLTQSLKSRP